VPRPVLITIGLSHFCEKARWALDRAGVGYIERAYPPILHYAATLRFRQRSTPILVTPHGVLRDSTAIVRHADQFLTEGDRLFPSDRTDLAEVERLVQLFDEKLGTATRRIAYFYLLDDRAVFTRTALARSGAVERAIFRASRPAVVQTIRRGLKIDRRGAQKSEERLEAVFDEADTLLVRGGPYLLGSRLTAADLTFAALAAPLLIPDRYPWPLPAFDETPDAFRALAERYRRRPAGVFALRFYSEQRGVVVRTANERPSP
jgi:glutathione S-transferase